MSVVKPGSESKALVAKPSTSARRYAKKPLCRSPLIRACRASWVFRSPFRSSSVMSPSMRRFQQVRGTTQRPKRLAPPLTALASHLVSSQRFEPDSPTEIDDIKCMHALESFSKWTRLEAAECIRDVRIIALPLGSLRARRWRGSGAPRDRERRTKNRGSKSRSKLASATVTTAFLVISSRHPWWWVPDEFAQFWMASGGPVDFRARTSLWSKSAKKD